MLLLTMLLALLLLALAGYAHKRIPAFTRGGRRIAVTRAALVLTGIGFGLVVVRDVDGRLPQLLGFLIGFGLVHVPAAIILLIKGRRGEGKS